MIPRSPRRAPRNPRKLPTGRRATVLGVVLSLLIPGLGHAYLGLLGRALIWFGGTVALAMVVGQEDQNTMLAAVMAATISISAAIDTLIMRRGE